MNARTGDPSRPNVPARHIALAAAMLLAATAPLLVGGCAGQNVRSEIVRDSTPAEDAALTPHERGEKRREALRVARAGWEAFETNDLDAMRSVFATDFVETYTELYADYEAEGRSRVRSYDVTFFDITSMTSSADRVSATIRFVDDSYYIEADGSQTEPAGAERSAEMVLAPEADSFIIVRIIASSEFLR